MEKDLIFRTHTPHPVASAADELVCLTIDPWEEHDGNRHAAHLAVLYISVNFGIWVLALSKMSISLEIGESFHFVLNGFVFAFKHFFAIGTEAW